jgi:hypothetical protein
MHHGHYSMFMLSGNLKLSGLVALDLLNWLPSNINIFIMPLIHNSYLCTKGVITMITPGEG